MKNRRCVTDAFFERPLLRKVVSPGLSQAPLATTFDHKSKKRHPKMHAKIDAEKVLKNDEKSIQNDAKMDAKINDF